MPRPQDPKLTDAILDAVVELLAERGFAALSMEAVARRANAGKPAIYRRFAGKTELVAAAIARALPPMAAPAGDHPDPRARFNALFATALPADGPAYVALIGGLMAEHRQHPELIEAFRETILNPRREVGLEAIRAAQRDGTLRSDFDAEYALELIAGPFLTRVFAGLDVGRRWRDQLFDRWWTIMAA